jgi:hypothetical protein
MGLNIQPFCRVDAVSSSGTGSDRVITALPPARSEILVSPPWAGQLTGSGEIERAFLRTRRPDRLRFESRRKIVKQVQCPLRLLRSAEPAAIA